LNSKLALLSPKRSSLPSIDANLCKNKEFATQTLAICRISCRRIEMYKSSSLRVELVAHPSKTMASSRESITPFADRKQYAAEDSKSLLATAEKSDPFK
jgi:hypothetical protein